MHELPLVVVFCATGELKTCHHLLHTTSRPFSTVTSVRCRTEGTVLSISLCNPFLGANLKQSNVQDQGPPSSKNYPHAMSRNRSQRATSPTTRQMDISNYAHTMRQKPTDLRSRSEPILVVSSVSRRSSKGGLREIFTKNRSSRTLAPTSEFGEHSLQDVICLSSITAVDPSWAPPPLFQAYPQSIKHVNLEASTLSAQAIIRLKEHRSIITMQDSDYDVTGISASSNAATKRSRRVPASTLKSEWTRKVYVLTTSGSLLQYSGEGAFDRKPEKILQLGKDSAAFASDAIEGRHFVLHVSQSCTDDGEPQLDRGIFSRIASKTASARRSARVLLMVFATADDLDSWLSDIRKMIGSLGGRSYNPETFVNDPKPLSRAEIGRLDLIRKDPRQFSPEVSRSGAMRIAPTERPSTQSSTYTATDLERLRDSNTSALFSIAGTPASVVDTPPPSIGHGPIGKADAPHLDLPDMGSSSLVDFSEHGKQFSRLSLMLPEIMRHNSPDATPISRLSREGSMQAHAPIRQISSLYGMDQNQEDIQQSQMECHDSTQEWEEDMSDDHDSLMDERPISTVIQLPPASSLRHTAPELPSSKRYSHLFLTSSENPIELPKRYSSLEYSRNLPHSQALKMASSPLQPSSQHFRRPISMQLRSEPTSLAHMPARSPSLRPFSQGRAKPADSGMKAAAEEDKRPPIKLCPRNATLPFGPPAGPPPSCPLPAVPVDALPVRRQSLAARDMIISENMSKEAQKVSDSEIVFVSANASAII